MLHIFTSGVAIRTTERLGLATSQWERLAGPLSRCIVTLLTGGMLLAIAAVGGMSYPIAKMFPDPYHARHPSKSTHGFDDLV